MFENNNNINDVDLTGKTIWEVGAMLIEKREEIEEVEEQNPFLDNLIIETKKKKQKIETEGVFNAEGTQIDLQASEISQVQYVDKGYFVKIMNKAIAAAFDMGSAGQKMFWYLMAEVAENVGKDAIYLHYSQAKTKRGLQAKISNGIYYRGLKDLETAGFIAANKQRKGFYWINPKMIFNGNRIKLVSTFILKQESEAGGVKETCPKIKRPGLKALGIKK